MNSGVFFFKNMGIAKSQIMWCLNSYPWSNILQYSSDKDGFLVYYGKFDLSSANFTFFEDRVTFNLHIVENIAQEKELENDLIKYTSPLKVTSTNSAFDAAVFDLVQKYPNYQRVVYNFSSFYLLAPGVSFHLEREC